MRAWENADFGPPARNRKKNRRKIDFGLTRKIGKKSPKNRKNGPKTDFRAVFPIFRRFFPYFPGEAKIDFSAIFSDFGPEARNRHSPRHAYSQGLIFRGKLSVVFFLSESRIRFVTQSFTACKEICHLELGCRKWGCNKWGLKGCLAGLPGNRPKSAKIALFLLFRPFPESAKSTWEIQKTEEKGLFPQISSDFLKPPSLKPPFAGLQ